MGVSGRLLRASITSDAVYQLLDSHKKEFAGADWMPANFFQRKRIVHILNRLKTLYADFESVDFTGLPGEAQLIKARYRMWLDLRLCERWQVKDHMRFLDSANAVLVGSRTIFERLRRLTLTGQIVRSLPPKKTQKQNPVNLLD